MPPSLMPCDTRSVLSFGRPSTSAFGGAPRSTTVAALRASTKSTPSAPPLAAGGAEKSSAADCENANGATGAARARCAANHALSCDRSDALKSRDAIAAASPRLVLRARRSSRGAAQSFVLARGAGSRGQPRLAWSVRRAACAAGTAVYRVALRSTPPPQWVEWSFRGGQRARRRGSLVVRTHRRRRAHRSGEPDPEPEPEPETLESGAATPGDGGQTNHAPPPPPRRVAHHHPQADAAAELAYETRRGARRDVPSPTRETRRAERAVARVRRGRRAALDRRRRALPRKRAPRGRRARRRGRAGVGDPRRGARAAE
mmetsp:Transcript_23418/g.70460  ORF Transcript_23418/g.70460 Transcript_23418/m.70460 type:complete len:316 (+) Transcript_23418:790-1737(+)